MDPMPFRFRFNQLTGPRRGSNALMICLTLLCPLAVLLAVPRPITGCVGLIPGTTAVSTHGRRAPHFARGKKSTRRVSQPARRCLRSGLFWTQALPMCQRRAHRRHTHAHVVVSSASLRSLPYSEQDRPHVFRGRRPRPSSDRSAMRIPKRAHEQTTARAQRPPSAAKDRAIASLESRYKRSSRAAMRPAESWL